MDSLINKHHHYTIIIMIITRTRLLSPIYLNKVSKQTFIITIILWNNQGNFIGHAKTWSRINQLIISWPSFDFLPFHIFLSRNILFNWPSDTLKQFPRVSHQESESLWTRTHSQPLLNHSCVHWSFGGGDNKELNTRMT